MIGIFKQALTAKAYILNQVFTAATYAGNLDELRIDADGKKFLWNNETKMDGLYPITPFGYITYNYDELKNCYGKGNVKLIVPETLLSSLKSRKDQEVSFCANPKLNKFSIKAGTAGIADGIATADSSKISFDLDCDYNFTPSNGPTIPYKYGGNDVAEQAEQITKMVAKKAEQIIKIVAKKNAKAIELGYITFILYPDGAISVAISGTEIAGLTFKPNQAFNAPSKKFVYTVPCVVLQTALNIFKGASLRFSEDPENPIMLVKREIHNLGEFVSGVLIGTTTPLTKRDIRERKQIEKEMGRAHDELELLAKTNETLQAEITKPKSVEIIVPPISEEIINESIKGKDSNWWTKNAPFPHPISLYSCYWAVNRKLKYIKQNPLTWMDTFKTFRAELGYPSDYSLILDSGGYDLSHDKDNPHHEEIVKFLTENPENVLIIAKAIGANRVMTLDIPPYEDDAFNCSPSYFQEALDKSDAYTEIEIAYHKAHKLSDIMLYGVIHGETYNKMMRWYNRMKKNQADLNGWALVPRPKSLKKIAMYICFVLENEINMPIHFLGVGSPDGLALIKYLQRKDDNGIPYFPHPITADSTRYNVGALFKTIIGKNPSYCDCRSCQYLDKDRGINKSLHNLNQLTLFTRTLTSKIDDPEDYMDYVRKNSTRPNELLWYFRQIDRIVAKKRRR